MKTITMNISVAELSDIAEVLELQSKYHIASINEEDKPSGFVTTAFTTDQLTALIQVESGLFIARIEGRLVAYAMAVSYTHLVARAKNQLGLEEFQRRNYAEAIDLLKQAAIADPADVEILSNLGFVSIQANRCLLYTSRCV